MYHINYHAPVLGTILSHFPAARPLVVRDASPDDTADDSAWLWSRARIQSGDYFVTLSTEVEKVAYKLGAQGSAEAAELERIASELLFAQTNYKIAKK